MKTRTHVGGKRADACLKDIERILRKDVKLVAEAKALADTDRTDLDEREARLAAAAREPSRSVPWYLADAAENTRMLAKSEVEKEVVNRRPVVLIVGEPMDLTTWEAHARLLQEKNEQQKLRAIEVQAVDDPKPKT